MGVYMAYIFQMGGAVAESRARVVAAPFGSIPLDDADDAYTLRIGDLSASGMALAGGYGLVLFRMSN